MRMSRGKADLEQVMRTFPRMQSHAAAAFAVGIDQGKNLAVDFCLRKRGDNEVAFPGAVTLGLPVLNRAAAADAEMRAKRFDTLRARLFDPHQLPPVRMLTRRGGDFDRLAAERVGNKEASPVGERNAIAEMADMIDEEALNHGARR